MSVSRAGALAPPEGLRPAQLGIVLVGRVVAGHASATLADLAQRGFLGLGEVSSAAGADWMLTDLRAPAAPGPLAFEAALLDGLFGQERVVRLSAAGPELLPVLNRFRAQLGRDACSVAGCAGGGGASARRVVSSCCGRSTASGGSCGHWRPQAIHRH